MYALKHIGTCAYEFACPEKVMMEVLTDKLGGMAGDEDTKGRLREIWEKAWIRTAFQVRYKAYFADYRMKEHLWKCGSNIQSMFCGLPSGEHLWKCGSTLNIGDFLVNTVFFRIKDVLGGETCISHAIKSTKV